MIKRYQMTASHFSSKCATGWKGPLGMIVLKKNNISVRQSMQTFTQNNWYCMLLPSQGVIRLTDMSVSYTHLRAHETEADL
eukprot:400858-Amphidinium_carterae.1